MSEAKESSNLSSESVYTQNTGSSSDHNHYGGLPHANGNAGGMLGGNIDKDSVVGIGGEGISFGIEGLDSVVATESAFEGNIFEKLFDGNLTMFGLTKSECFAIKSLGALTALNSLSISKQFKLDLKQNLSISSKGMEQG